MLALICHSHHEEHGHFPTGGWGPRFVGDPDRGYGPDQPGGWLFNLLSYDYGDALRALGSDGDPLTISAEQKTAARQVMMTERVLAYCPSRQRPAILPTTGVVYNADLGPQLAARSDYAINSGTYYVEFGDGPHCTVDYTPAESYAGWLADSVDIINNPWKLNGISYQRSQVTRDDVTDGTAKTILLGEKFIPRDEYRTGTHPGDDGAWCSGFSNDNHRGVLQVRQGRSWTYFPPAHDKDRRVLSDPQNSRGANRFGSAHVEIWNAAFCDGSARALSYEIDPVVAVSLADRRDGQDVNTEDF